MNSVYISLITKQTHSVQVNIFKPNYASYGQLGRSLTNTKRFCIYRISFPFPVILCNNLDHYPYVQQTDELNLTVGLLS